MKSKLEAERLNNNDNNTNNNQDENQDKVDLESLDNKPLKKQKLSHDLDNKTNNENELQNNPEITPNYNPTNNPNTVLNNSKYETTNVADLLENELQSLRSNKAKLFFNFETNCKGVVFIKIDKEYRNLIDIKRIIKYIIDNIKENKEQVSKNIARFVPVEIAMKAKFENFEKNASLVIDKYFKNDDEINNNSQKKTWKLEFKCRNNNSIHKDLFLNFLLDKIDRNRFQVDYKNPELTILIEITNDLLCLSVLEDYLENKSYNLLTLSKSEEELKLERDRLMAKQKEREDEKKLAKEGVIGNDRDEGDGVEDRNENKDYNNDDVNLENNQDEGDDDIDLI